MSFSESLMKFILGFINLIFLLAGAVMLAFGITAYADPSAIAKIFEAVLPSSSQKDLDAVGVDISGIVISNAAFMIVLGVIAVVIAIFGFVGACCMIRWMLVVYAIVLIVFLLAEIALIIFAAVFTEQFKDKIQEGMFTSLKDKYKKGLQINGTDIHAPTGAVELAWETMQFKEKCCGAYNYSDYQRFKWHNDIQPINSDAKVPISCCKKTDTATGDIPTQLADFVDLPGCLQGNVLHINDQNCYDAVKSSVEDFITQYKFIAIGIAIAICVIELLLIIFAFCLCARANDENKFV